MNSAVHDVLPLRKPPPRHRSNDLRIINPNRDVWQFVIEGSLYDKVATRTATARHLNQFACSAVRTSNVSWSHILVGCRSRAARDLADHRVDLAGHQFRRGIL